MRRTGLDSCVATAKSGDSNSSSTLLHSLHGAGGAWPGSSQLPARACPVSINTLERALFGYHCTTLRRLLTHTRHTFPLSVYSNGQRIKAPRVKEGSLVDGKEAREKGQGPQRPQASLVSLHDLLTICSPTSQGRQPRRVIRLVLTWGGDDARGEKRRDLTADVCCQQVTSASCSVPNGRTWTRRPGR